VNYGTEKGGNHDQRYEVQPGKPHSALVIGAVLHPGVYGKTPLLIRLPMAIKFWCGRFNRFCQEPMVLQDSLFRTNTMDPSEEVVLQDSQSFDSI